MEQRAQLRLGARTLRRVPAGSSHLRQVPVQHFQRRLSTAVQGLQPGMLRQRPGGCWVSRTEGSTLHVLALLQPRLHQTRMHRQWLPCALLSGHARGAEVRDSRFCGLLAPLLAGLACMHPYPRPPHPILCKSLPLTARVSYGSTPWPIPYTLQESPSHSTGLIWQHTLAATQLSVLTYSLAKLVITISLLCQSKLPSALCAQATVLTLRCCQKVTQNIWLQRNNK